MPMVPSAPGRKSQAPIFRAHPDLVPKERKRPAALAPVVASADFPGHAARPHPAVLREVRRDVPDWEEWSPVQPQTIFAAGKDRFECVVRGVVNSGEAKILIFAKLPLEQHGWDRDAAALRHLRNVPAGMVFLVEKH